MTMSTCPVATFAMGSDNSSADKPDEEKIICKREVATGSIMSRRVCHTKAEWKAIAEQGKADIDRSEEHTSELQSLMRISYAVFCLKKKKPTAIHVMKHRC